MKIKPLLEKISLNWPAKAVCIVIACFVYLFNRYTSLEKKSVPISLAVIQDGEMVSATHIPSSVSVTIRTSAENISKVGPENITAELDLSWIAQEGTYEVPVLLDLPPNIVELDPLQVTVYPEKVKVRLEKNTLKTVKILPQTTGKPADGYTITELSAEPEYVSIYGPRSIVQSVDSITTKGVSVEGASQNFSEEAAVVNLNRLLKIYGEDKTQVSVKIDYEEGIKEFKGLPVFLRGLSASFECETQKKGSIKLRGPRLLMNEWTPNPDTLSVDLGDITEAGDYTLPVSVLIPQEFHLESVSLENITVSVKRRPPAEVVDETLPGAVLNQNPESED